MKNEKYLELIIEINPKCSEIICDILFENFDCSGVVTNEQEFKDLELIKETPDVVKAYIAPLDEIEIKNKLELARNNLLAAGIAKDFLGTWNFKIQEMENLDWSQKWKENWQPTKISEKIVICPSWLTYPKVNNEIIINIDPGGAFGTGTHPTTQLCALALEKYLTKDNTVADIGTGSGILAFIAEFLGAKSVIGIDNDEVAIDVAIENAAINNIQKCRFFTQEIFSLNEEYDFVTANILHNVLADIMPELKRILKINAKMVLSGILDEKKQVVLDAINDNKLKLVEILKKDNWVAIIVEK